MKLSKNVLRASIASVLCLGIMGMAHSQGKVGFVSSEKLMIESAPAKAATAKIEKEFEPRRKELENLEKKLTGMAEKFEKERQILSESDAKKRYQDIVNAEKDFRTKEASFRQDLMKKRQEEFSKVASQAEKIIQNIAEKEGYDVILQNPPAYIKPELNLTERVINELGR